MSVDVTTVSDPTAEPITVSDAKSYIRIGHGKDDTIISGLIQAERKNLENQANRSFITQTKIYRTDQLKTETKLPYGPVQSITSVATIDSAGSTSDIDTSDYYQASDRLVFEEAPPVEEREVLGFEVKYQTGFSDSAAGVDEDIKTALKDQVAHRYEMRGQGGSGQEVTPMARTLINDAKVWSL